MVIAAGVLDHLPRTQLTHAVENALPFWGLYFPKAQAMHAVDEKAPVCALHLPAPQLEHSIAPRVS